VQPAGAGDALNLKITVCSVLELASKERRHLGILLRRWVSTCKVHDRRRGDKRPKDFFADVGLVTRAAGNYKAIVCFVAEGMQVMTTPTRSAIRRGVTAVGIAGGAAAIATGMALAGAGTAAAENQHNVVTQGGNKFTPKSAAITSPRSSVGASQSLVASDPGTNFLVNLGTALSNAQIQVGTAGTNAISQTGTALGNGQVQLGTAGNDALTQVGTAGNNALTQVGNAGYGVLNGIGNLFNRG
jgi:hypothetical protein